MLSFGIQRNREDDAWNDVFKELKLNLGNAEHAQGISVIFVFDRRKIQCGKEPQQFKSQALYPAQTICPHGKDTAQHTSKRQLSRYDVDGGPIAPAETW